MTIMWPNKTCAGCLRPYQTPLPGPMGDFCPLCRIDFGMRTDKDAEEILQYIDLGILIPGAIPPKEKKTVLFTKDDKKALAALTMKASKPSPEAVAAGVRAMTGHQLASVPTYEAPITYVTAKSGLFEVRSSDLMTVVSRPKEVLGVVEDLKEGITLNLPKIPFAFLIQTISFFRGVIERQKGSSEALVQVWWDREEKAHHLHVPEQQVSGGGVHHQSTFDRENEGRWLHVADIHSHGSTMGAFWSGIDDADERRVTTERLFGVIGKVLQPIPEWKWRMRTRDGFVDLAAADLFDIPKTTFNFTVTSEVLFRQIEVKENVKDGWVTLQCPVDPFATVEVPPEWYEQVKGYSYGGRGQSGFVPHGAAGPRFPQAMKGYIYIDGKEYEVAEGIMKPTGHQLIPKGEKVQ